MLGGSTSLTTRKNVRVRVYMKKYFHVIFDICVEIDDCTSPSIFATSDTVRQKLRRAPVARSWPIFND